MSAASNTSSASLAYRRALTEQASPIGLVIALCDTLVTDLQRAIVAMRCADLGAIAERSNQLKHALQVLGQLNGLLDIANGGDCAHNLARFYEHLRRSILLAQFQKNPSALEVEVRNVLQVRTAWQQLDDRTPVSTQQAGSVDEAQPNPRINQRSEPWTNRSSFSCSA